MSIKQIDTCLKRYYKYKNVVYENSDGMGKFEAWCEENEYDTEAITEEFQQQPAEIAFIDFDENFPTTSTDDKDKINEIFKVLYACYKEPAAFFDSADLPNEYTNMEYTQLERAKQQSLHDQSNNTINNTMSTRELNDPHISFVPTSKTFTNSKDDIKNVIKNDIDDIYHVDNINNYNNNYYKASDPVYESSLRSSNLSISLIKDTELKLAYETATKLLNIGNKAFINNRDNDALQNYSKMILYLGINSVRKLKYFYSNNNNYTDIIHEGIDKLRISAYIGMSYIYKKQNKWNKVIEKCSEILEQDNTNMNIFALLLRGIGYGKLGKLEKARNDLENAKKSKYVYIEIEKELNLLNNINSNIINNNNWPQLPIRNIMFEQWLDSNNDNINIYEILYPIPHKKYEYKLYKNEEMLDMAILWLDIDVAKKLINLNIFNVNKQNKIYKQQTYINQLTTGNLLSGLKYTQNVMRFTKLFMILCNNKNIDLELEDINNYTPLANAIKNNINDLVSILLKYGANINHQSVKLQIKQNKNNIKHIIRQTLDCQRQNTFQVIQCIISNMYGITSNKIGKEILDFILSSWKEEEQQEQEEEENNIDDID